MAETHGSGSAQPRRRARKAWCWRGMGLRWIIPAWVVMMAGMAPAAGADLELPEKPPEDWHLNISFDISDDILLTYLHEKPKDDYLYISGRLSLWYHSNFSAIRGPIEHPVLTHQLEDTLRIMSDFMVLGFVPDTDQKALYTRACKLLEMSESVKESVAFNFGDPNAVSDLLAPLFEPTSTPLPADYDASGVNVSVKLTINDRVVEAEYRKLQPGGTMPDELATLLALIYRNLPESYDEFFKSMGIVRPPALIGEAASQIRKCKVHDEWMKIGDIPIKYGLLIPPPGYAEACNRDFPNANNEYWGGCVTTPDSPKQDKGLYCKSCRKAEANWSPNWQAKELPTVPLIDSITNED